MVSSQILKKRGDLVGSSKQSFEKSGQVQIIYILQKCKNNKISFMTFLLVLDHFLNWSKNVTYHLSVEKCSTFEQKIIQGLFRTIIQLITATLQ